MKRNAFFSAKNIATLAVLLALVLVLQSVALVTGIFLPTSLSFVLIPIVIGTVVMGAYAGGILGLMFGIIVIIYGLCGLDSFTFYLLSTNPVLTVLTCLLKGVVAGVVPAILYRVISKKNRYIGVFVAALSAPICNTGIFILGAMTMWGTFSELAASNGENIMYFIIITCALTNFLIEFFSTAIAAPAVYRVTEIVKGKHRTALKETDESQVSETLTQENQEVSQKENTASKANS